MTNREACIILSLLPGVGPVKVKQLLKVYGSLDEIFESKESALVKTEGISKKIAKSLFLANYFFPCNSAIKKKVPKIKVFNFQTQ